MLKAQALGKAVQGRSIIDEVSFSLAPGETIALVGPSGCGKTTLLYMLCGLTRPSCGTVTLQGQLINRPTKDIAIILQDYGLLPWKTVLGNVCLGLRIQGVAKATAKSKAMAVLTDMGLAHRAEEYPGLLSGGEQQRVAIARALALDPKLLLMDEPFSSLDFITREKLQQIFLDTWKRQGTPYIVVTHSVEEAVFLGRRIIVMGGSPASITARVDNPGFASPDYRNTPIFHHTTQLVRAALAKVS